MTHLKSDQEVLEEFEERFPGPLMFKEEIKSFLVKLRQKDRENYKEEIRAIFNRCRTEGGLQRSLLTFLESNK